MPKEPSKFTSFPRRRFALYIPFDDDHTSPYEITFPISDSVPRPTSPHPQGRRRATPPSASAPRQNRISVAGQEISTASGPLLRADSDSEGESEDERPYEHLLDKSLHGKGTSFYYYLYNSSKTLSGPPPRPPHMSIRVGTIFVHRNPNTSVIRSWRLEISEGGAEEWIALQDLEERPFDLGTYYYTVSDNGTPSWVKRDTVRKRKYYKPQASRQRRGRREDTPGDDQATPDPQEAEPTRASLSDSN
ncbi:hypothetical protein FA13DRAFT_1799069 [Coprinellus micaceus]|uniref:Uncharacterized protein n=1 Tax=Coprinellus micaceus TaxID=71717 RepID=A0A4Y7SK85_COPMI|nr:hypothetical protein FA13DRAFT_1799069 [Coprinellus micaceus]